MNRIIVPSIVVRPILPPPAKIAARLQPQHMHWQVGKYVERLTSGYGGLGRGRVWVTELEGEQHNMILDVAYDQLIAQYGFYRLPNYAAVGTGSTPPSQTQTALVNEVARTQTHQSGYDGVIDVLFSGTPGVYDIQSIREFSEAKVGGRNLTEWGFSPTSSGPLTSRELFRDGSGNPIVLTLASDQRLRLIYKIRVSIGPTVQPVSINISGIGTITGTLRLYRYSNQSPYRLDFETADALASAGANFYGVEFAFSSDYPSSNYDHYFWYNGSYSKGASFSPPSGRSRQTTQQVYSSTQANGTWYGHGIGFYRYPYYFVGGVGIAFDTPITKRNTHRLELDPWGITWGP